MTAPIGHFADYEIEGVLSEGNHGRFLLAVPPARLGLDVDRVVLKLIEGRTDEESFRRFSRELQMFAAVRSPYLVRLFDAGQQDGTFFYSTEHFPLGSLETAADGMPMAERLRAVTHAALAAHSLHESGIAHRDIRPGNILVHGEGSKLSDLGLAHLTAAGQSVTSMPSFAALEFTDPGIIKGARPSRASDIWSLGSTLHRVVTGRSVYGELDVNDGVLAVRTVLRTHPRVDAAVPASIADLVSSCLEPDPAARPETAMDVADVLRARGAAA